MESRWADSAEIKQTEYYRESNAFFKVCPALRIYLVWRLECWSSCLCIVFFFSFSSRKVCPTFLSCPCAKKEEVDFQLVFFLVHPGGCFIRMKLLEVVGDDEPLALLADLLANLLVKFFTLVFCQLSLFWQWNIPVWLERTALFSFIGVFVLLLLTKCGWDLTYAFLLCLYKFNPRNEIWLSTSGCYSAFVWGGSCVY